MSTRVPEPKFSRASLFLLDISGSMQQCDCSNGKSRLANAQEGIIQNLEIIRNNRNTFVQAKFKVVPFDLKAHLDRIDIIAVEDLNSFSKIREEECVGGTAIFDSLDQTLSSLEKWDFHGATHVDFVLLTDGEDNSSSDSSRKKFAHIEKILKESGGTLKCICFVIGNSKKDTVNNFVKNMNGVLPMGSDVHVISDASEIPTLLVKYGEKVERNFHKEDQAKRLALAEELILLSQSLKNTNLSVSSPQITRSLNRIKELGDAEDHRF